MEEEKNKEDQRRTGRKNDSSLRTETSKFLTLVRVAVASTQF